MAIEFKTPEVIEKHLRGIQVVAENAMRPDSRFMDEAKKIAEGYKES